MGVIRGSCLLNYRELVAELGADPDPLLRQAGVRPRDAGQHEVFISYRSLVLAMESAARVTGTPDFGRQLALRQGLEILGPVGVAARTATTMGEALRICSVYLSAYSPSVAVSLQPLPEPSRTFFEFRVVPTDLPPLMQTVELSLGIALEIFRYLRGDDYRPLRVHLPHQPITDRESYRRYFGCTPRFSERTAGFTLRTADLDKALSGDAQAHQVILRYLDTVVTGDEPTMSAPVRRLVRQLLPTGTVTMDRIAQQFAMHPKMFQRRLAREGATFGSLVDETRKDLATHYLRDTDLGLTQVSRELGYAEQSVLTRSCRRWFGMGPAALREHLRALPA